MRTSLRNSRMVMEYNFSSTGFAQVALAAWIAVFRAECFSRWLHRRVSVFCSQLCFQGGTVRCGRGFSRASGHCVLAAAGLLSSLIGRLKSTNPLTFDGFKQTTLPLTSETKILPLAADMPSNTAG